MIALSFTVKNIHELDMEFPRITTFNPELKYVLIILFLNYN